MFQCTKSGEKMQDEPESSEEYTHNYIYPLYLTSLIRLHTEMKQQIIKAEWVQFVLETIT